MVTTRFARSAVPLATSPLAFTWRFAELFWPDLPAPCGLDAEAARLLRYSLTLAVEQALEQHRKVGAPLPPRCDLALICQERFDPLAIQWRQRGDDLRALLQTEVQMTLALAQRPLGGQDGGKWTRALAGQCQRVGQLYQALARQAGQAKALAALTEALEWCQRPAC